MGYTVTAVEDDSSDIGAFIGDLARKGGLGVRAALSGIPKFAAQVVGDPINELVNMATGQRNPRISDRVESAMTSAGFPEPQTADERVSYDVSQALSSGAGVIRGGAALAQAAFGPVARGVGTALASNPGVQMLSSGASSGASSVARENDASPTAQLLSGLLGGLAPGAIYGAGAPAIRGLVRGGEAGRQAFSDRAADFRQAGTEASVGQAGDRLSWVERLFSKTPGGVRKMSEFGSGQQDDVGQAVNALADQVSAPRDTVRVGRDVQKGLESWTDWFRSREGFYWDKLDPVMKGQNVALGNTFKALSDMTSPVSNAPATSQHFINSEIESILASLRTDSKTGWLPYQAVRELRTKVGEKLSNPSLLDDVSRQEWSRLYGALSEDIGARATQLGAGQEWNRANQFSRGGHQRVEDFMDAVAKKTSPEDAVKMLTSPGATQWGASRLEAVSKSLEAAGPVGRQARDALQADFIRRLGRSTPGNQDAAGEAFSTETFLTNWSKLSPQAKNVLFPDADVRRNLEAVARTSDRIRETTKQFANPSGSGVVGGQIGAMTGAASAAFTGHPEWAAAIAAGALGVNSASRLLTNKDFVRWLGESTKFPKGLPPAFVQQLVALEPRMDDDGKEALREYLGHLQRATEAGWAGRQGSR